MDNWETQDGLEPIAIIGMAGRFPGANNVKEGRRQEAEGRRQLDRDSDPIQLKTTKIGDLEGDLNPVWARHKGFSKNFFLSFCHLPSAICLAQRAVNAFWQNLRDGVESISLLSEQEEIEL